MVEARRGGAVWDGISYDPESELLYVGTGNAEPWPQALRTKDVSTGTRQPVRGIHRRRECRTPAN